MRVICHLLAGLRILSLDQQLVLAGLQGTRDNNGSETAGGTLNTLVANSTPFIIIIAGWICRINALEFSKRGMGGIPCHILAGTFRSEIGYTQTFCLGWS